MKPSLPVDINILAEYNRTHPWAKLQAWFQENLANDKMLYKGAAEKQIMFVRDEFRRLFKDDLIETSAVGTHISKSIILPVYQVVLKGGVVLTMRDNFHNWKVTVQSPVPLEFPSSLFSDGVDKDISSSYCEGFTDDQVLPSYSKDRQNFTVEIYDQQRLFVLMFLLREQLRLNQDKTA